MTYVIFNTVDSNIIFSSTSKEDFVARTKAIAAENEDTVAGLFSAGTCIRYLNHQENLTAYIMEHQIQSWNNNFKGYNAEDLLKIGFEVERDDPYMNATKTFGDTSLLIYRNYEGELKGTIHKGTASLHDLDVDTKREVHDVMKFCKGICQPDSFVILSEIEKVKKF